MTDLVCASYPEKYALRKSGPAIPIGLGARHMPSRKSRLDGYFGSLTDDLPVGTRIVVRSLVDESGVEIWKPESARKPRGAIEVKALAVDHVVDDPNERKKLHQETRAHVVSMEAGPLARAGLLIEAFGAISDNPSFPLGLLANVMTPDGEIDPRALLWALRLDLLGTARRICNILPARRALKRTDW